MRAHYLHVTDLTSSAATTEKEDDDDINSGLRRYDNQKLHPGNISNIPGLNPVKQQNTDEFSRRQTKATMMLGSSFRRQKKDILTQDELKALSNTADRLTFTEPTKTTATTTTLPTTRQEVQCEEINEIPLIDQMISSRRGGHCIERNVRPELVPVDDKMKLYFAYNRKTGSISRVIATAPRAHFAQKVLQKQQQ